jgi:Fe-S-cluster containining protein
LKRTEKLLKLDRIYELYDNVISQHQFACKKHCTACCTRNVILTTLEGTKLVEYMKMSGQTSLIELVKNSISKNRFRPKITTNRIAQYCVSGREIPDEEVDPAWGKCPLLKADLCPVYDARPFGCRCLVSEDDCAKTGYARIDPYILTINDIFLQHIEHLDHQGMTGNLSDILLFIESKTKKDHSKNEISYPDVLIRNHQIQVLMIPPEYRNRVKPILETLKNILS